MRALTHQATICFHTDGPRAWIGDPQSLLIASSRCGDSKGHRRRQEGRSVRQCLGSHSDDDLVAARRERRPSPTVAACGAADDRDR